MVSHIYNEFFHIEFGRCRYDFIKFSSRRWTGKGQQQLQIWAKRVVKTFSQLTVAASNLSAMVYFHYDGIFKGRQFKMHSIRIRTVQDLSNSIAEEFFLRSWKMLEKMMLIKIRRMSGWKRCQFVASLNEPKIPIAPKLSEFVNANAVVCNETSWLQYRWRYGPTYGTMLTSKATIIGWQWPKVWIHAGTAASEIESSHLPDSRNLSHEMRDRQLITIAVLFNNRSSRFFHVFSLSVYPTEMKFAILSYLALRNSIALEA